MIADFTQPRGDHAADTAIVRRTVHVDLRLVDQVLWRAGGIRAMAVVHDGERLVCDECQV
jgi:hypothetical protein